MVTDFIIEVGEGFVRIMLRAEGNGALGDFTHDLLPGESFHDIEYAEWRKAGMTDGMLAVE